LKHGGKLHSRAPNILAEVNLLVSLTEPKTLKLSPSPQSVYKAIFLPPFFRLMVLVKGNSVMLLVAENSFETFFLLMVGKIF